MSPRATWPGPLTVDRLTGDITAESLTGPLDLRSQAGEITGHALRTEVLRAESEDGDVRLELVVPPRTVEITAENGEVDLAVPAATAYRVDARADTGLQRVLVPLDPGSPHSVRIDGDNGDVTVRPTR
jgi:DUF4097 and DUF4098 domain-containing protein YvlB